MTKCLVKFMIVVLIIIAIFQIISNNTLVFAGGININDEINGFVTGEAKGNTPNIAKNLGGTFITIFQVVGTGVALIMLIVLAMKYMLASAGDKADIKKHAVVYIVGAICLFAGAALLEIFQKFAESIK